MTANCLSFLLASLPGTPTESDAALAREVERFIQGLARHTRASSVLNELRTLLAARLRPAGHAVFVLDAATGTLVLSQGTSKSAPPPPPSLPADCPIARLLRSGATGWIELESGATEPPPTPALEAARQQLRSWGQRAALPLVAGETLIGFLTLGRGPSDRPHTLPERVCLTVLAQHLAVALDRLLTDEGLDLLGRVSPGVFHDLQDLLTPISTLLQLQAEGREGRQKADRMLPHALRNLELLRVQLRRARMLSEERQLRVAPVRLDRVIRRAVRSANARIAERQVRVECPAPTDVTAELDEALILRLLANLLSNAIQASPPGGLIRIGLIQPESRAGGNERVEISIADQGPGIAPAKREQLLAPAFAQCRMEADDGGVGLGLPISKEIVRLHRGTLELLPGDHGGTVAKVSLPVARGRATALRGRSSQPP